MSQLNFFSSIDRDGYDRDKLTIEVKEDNFHVVSYGNYVLVTFYVKDKSTSEQAKFACLDVIREIKSLKEQPGLKGFINSALHEFKDNLSVITGTSNFVYFTNGIYIWRDERGTT